MMREKPRGRVGIHCRRDRAHVADAGDVRRGGGLLMRLFCFGFGYSAEALARRLSARVSALGGTRTSLAGAESPLGAKLAVFQGDGASAEVRGLLAGTTHLLVSVPPDLEGDMVLRHFRD